MFTENDCTDILAMPDGGDIKAIKTKINNLVEQTVDRDIETCFGTTPASKGLRRVTLIKALGAAWDWFRAVHHDLPHRLGQRTGQVFQLTDDRVVQFENCRFRGYNNKDLTSKNPFSDKSFSQSYKEYKERNTVRRQIQEQGKVNKELHKVKE